MALFNKSDVNAMRDALNSDDPWGYLDEMHNRLKIKIKNFVKKGKYCCCYCRRCITIESNRSFDVEHILPQKKYKKLVFSSRNLSVSCIRCNNSPIKGDDDSYYLGGDDYLDKNKYLIIHPNLERYKDHINYFEINANDNIVRLYEVVAGSKKGLFTYEYFRLKDLVEEDVLESLKIERVNNKMIMEIIA
jgi:hypothetical protein